MREMTIAIYNGREEPACWSWVVPAMLPAFPGEDAAGHYLREWHEWQCAICGCLYPEYEDHDHGTGLVRGYLCRSCNTREGRSDAALYRNFRERNPASMLGIRVEYWNPYTRLATP